MYWLTKALSGAALKKIWQQIFLILILIAVVPIVILGSLLIKTSQKAVQTSVLRDHEELAIRAAGEVNEFLQKPQELLVAVASIIGVSHLDPWRQETAIVELSLRYPMFRRISSLDLDGNEIAVSELGSARISRAKEPAFLKARAGAIYISSVKLDGNDTPVATMAAPITQWGKITGVLTADVDLRGVWDIVDGIQVGQTGYASVVERSGALISHPNKKLVLGKESLFNNKIVGAVLSGKTGSDEDEGSDSQRWLVAYAPIKSTGWGLMIFQSAAEAYAFSKIMIAQSWFFILLGVFLAFMISMWLSQFMSRPLNQLLDGTRRIAQNDFEHPIPVIRDDEIGQILKSFNLMTEKLKFAQQVEKLSIIGKAATTIAHELKNSLVLVDTYIQLLAERYQDEKFIQDFLAVVPQELNAWKGMLKNMVEYTRIPHFSMDRISVDHVINSICPLLAMRAKKNGIDIVISNHNENSFVKGNEDKLRQVVLNLVTNAIESTPSGGSIKISSFTAQDMHSCKSNVVIEVRNTGSEIPLSRLGKIFDPFFTTKDGGLGLGLAISKEIVSRHGGAIKVASSKTDGTFFQVHLPEFKGQPDVL